MPPGTMPDLGQPVDPTPRPKPERIVHRGAWTTLEPLGAQHAEALWPAARDAPESWAWLPFGPFPDEARFRGYLRFAAASPAELVWAVRPHGKDGTPGDAAGWLALLDIQPAHAAIELGNIWFPPGLARTRAATEAMFLLLDYAFGLGYRRVGWKCNALNLASRRAAERLGFRFEGILRAHMVVRGHRRDTAWFSLLDEEWPARRRAIADWLAPANFDAEGRAIRRLERPEGVAPPSP
ncbi:MAG: GNAT family N-acetyltransferase [Acetobacteraceae bacterium]|nr:GNAT family N-acetyltransferase [Acetobacteraceae bacterium]